MDQRNGFRLLILLLGVWPAAWAVLGFSAPASWLLVSFAVFFLVAWLSPQLAPGARARRLSLGLLAFAYLLVNWLLAVSFYTQASGFNDQLFFHLNWGSLEIAWETNRWQMLTQFSALAALPAVVWLASAPRRDLPATGSHRSALLFFLMTAAMITSYPVLDLLGYLVERQRNIDNPPAALTRYEQDGSATPKNLILIYAESLEASYFDQSVFPADLLPSLTRLKQEATVFSDVRQRQGTGWTVAGIVSSQCGFSVKVNNPFSRNTRLAATPEPYPSATCLGDIAKHLGYRTLFLGGARGTFAGKGNFLRTHGFDSVLGRTEIVAAAESPLELSPWGVHDDDLFDLALSSITEFERGDAPYFLSLLTLDTHHPDGYPASNCPEYDSQDPMEKALACSDAQIGSFIERVRQTASAEDTLIAVFSDHLAMRNSSWKKLAGMGGDRRLMFMLLEGEEGRTVDTTLTHYDIGATLLEATGAAQNVRIGFGKSAALLALEGPHASGYAQAFYAEEPQGLNLFDDGLAFNKSDRSIAVGDTVFPITENGGLFVYGVYLLVFDDDGAFSDVVYARNLDAVRASVRGKIVAFAELPQGGDELRFFVGRLSRAGEEGREFTQFDSLQFSAGDLREFSD